MKKAFGAACVLLLAVLIGAANVPVNEIARQKVMASGEWQEVYDSYKPDPAKIGILKSKLGSDLRIDIYLGLWCPDSKNNVPAFLKMLDATEIATPVHFYSVERKPVKTIKYFSDRFEIEKVPTFIFYRGDAEIGRIIENPSVGLVEDSIAILSK